MRKSIDTLLNCIIQNERRLIKSKQNEKNKTKINTNEKRNKNKTNINKQTNYTVTII